LEGKSKKHHERLKIQGAKFARVPNTGLSKWVSTQIINPITSTFYYYAVQPYKLIHADLPQKILYKILPFSGFVMHFLTVTLTEWFAYMLP
jgi:hypothetical protein